MFSVCWCGCKTKAFRNRFDLVISKSSEFERAAWRPRGRRGDIKNRKACVVMVAAAVSWDQTQTCEVMVPLTIRAPSSVSRERQRGVARRVRSQ
jgi:hypothetical protein